MKLKNKQSVDNNVEYLCKKVYKFTYKPIVQGIFYCVPLHINVHNAVNSLWFPNVNLFGKK